MSLSFVCKTKFLAKVLLWLAVSEYGVSEYGVSPASLSKKNCKFKKKTTKRQKAFSDLMWRLHTSKGYVGPIRRATVDQKFLGLLKKEGLQQQLSSKICKILDDKDQKRAKVH
jgi:hypothetical protein